MGAINVSDEFWDYASKNEDELSDSWISHYKTWCAGRESYRSEELCERMREAEKLKRFSDSGFDIDLKLECIDGVYRSIRDIEEEKCQN